MRGRRGRRNGRDSDAQTNAGAITIMIFIDSLSGLDEKSTDNASIMLMGSSVECIIGTVRLPEQILFQW